MDVTLREADSDDLQWAQARWASIGFRTSGSEDRVVIAWIGGERAGVGRIVPLEPGVGELGGMYVDPAFRGQGLAPLLVHHLLERWTGTLFCIPFVHLRALYEGCGFARVPEDADLPVFVQEKVRWCARTYPDPVLVLKISCPAGGC